MKNKKQSDDKQGTNKSKKLKAKPKFLTIGWKHRSSRNAPFIEQSAPFGGLKKLELDQNTVYTCQQIIQGVSAFKNENTKNYLQS